jgi:hypothetical protein
MSLPRPLIWILSDHKRILIAALAAVSMLAAVYTFAGGGITTNETICANTNLCPSPSPLPDSNAHGTAGGAAADKDGLTGFLGSLPTTGASLLIFVFSVVFLSTIYYVIDFFKERRKR